MDKQLTNLQEELIRVYKRISWWAAHHQALMGLVEDMDKVGFDATVTSSGLEFSGAGDKAKLLAMFRTMRKHGYTPSSRPAAETTYFYAYWDRADGIGSVWVGFTSTVCKRVQVGTEMKEVAVYEVRCGENMEVTDEELNDA